MKTGPRKPTERMNHPTPSLLTANVFPVIGRGGMFHSFRWFPWSCFHWNSASSIHDYRSTAGEERQQIESNKEDLAGVPQAGDSVAALLARSRRSSTSSSQRTGEHFGQTGGSHENRTQ